MSRKKRASPDASPRQGPPTGGASPPPIEGARPQLLSVSRIAVCALLALVTFAAYERVLGNDFLGYDDGVYVSENPHVVGGLTLPGLRWAFTTGTASNWHPLTWLSHMLDCQLFGLSPGSHHLVSLLIHIANAILLLLVLERLTGAMWPSAFVAGLFALHPAHVESVAWIAERKDVLSGLFWILTMGAYALYVESLQGGVADGASARQVDGGAGGGKSARLRTSIRRAAARYALVIGLYALGLLAKPMLVTLPFVLLLLDFWPLRRLSTSPIGWLSPSEPGVLERGRWVVVLRTARLGRGGATARGGESGEGKDTRASSPVAPVPPSIPAALCLRVRGKRFVAVPWPLAEKLPLFALAAASSAATFFVQRSTGAVAPIAKFPIGRRVANAIVAYARYIGEAVWPSRLSVFYPHPDAWAPWQIAGALALVIVLTAVAVRGARRLPFLATGWLWYLGTLVPVIGLVQVGMQSMADRYTYIPYIGLFIVVSWTARSSIIGWEARGAARLLGARLAAGILAAALLATCAAATWVETGYWRDTVTLFDRALAVTRNNAVAENILANTLAKKGRFDDAIAHFEGALRILPDDDTHDHFGLALAFERRFTEAIAHYRAALAINPSNADAHENLAEALDHENRTEEAIAEYRESIRLRPGNAKAHNNLAACLEGLGKTDAAIAEYREAVVADPSYAEAHANLGSALLAAGRAEEAVVECREAARIKPDDADAHYNLGAALLKLGRVEEAKEEFSRVLRLRPNDKAAGSRLLEIGRDPRDSARE